MAALPIFAEVEALAELVVPRRHLAGVAGMDPVVQRRAVVEGRRIMRDGAQVLIGRIKPHERPVAGHVGIAIFADPARAGEQVRIAPHVGERRAGDDRGIEVGPLVRRRADQDAAVRAARNAELAARRDARCGSDPRRRREDRRSCAAGSRAAPPRARPGHIRRRRGCWRGHRHCPPRPRTGRAGRSDRAGR